MDRQLYFFDAFGTVILPKSCSRCGGSNAFKVQTLQNRLWRRFRMHVLGLGRVFFADFRFPASSRNGVKTGPSVVKESLTLAADKQCFVVSSVSLDAFRTGPGPIPEAPRILQDQTSVRFHVFLQFCGIRLDLVGVCRVPLGVAGIRTQPQ